jgi:hypothetical protein
LIAGLEDETVEKRELDILEEGSVQTLQRAIHGLIRWPRLWGGESKHSGDWGEGIW